MENLNLKTILVRTGYGGLDAIYKVKPDHIYKNFKAAKKYLSQNDFN